MLGVERTRFDIIGILMEEYDGLNESDFSILQLSI
jgi:hypothetical protein